VCPFRVFTGDMETIGGACIMSSPRGLGHVTFKISQNLHLTPHQYRVQGCWSGAFFSLDPVCVVGVGGGGVVMYMYVSDLCDMLLSGFSQVS
jgi:hypothetical protein